ncbi:hypothetical protein, partial [Micromonospora sp. TSRI0369]|uniref:hypothetical protein n=1 Tax=Micromonospora sp. TSRI0369 TaxID=1703936 RepID=UPI001A7E15C9
RCANTSMIANVSHDSVGAVVRREAQPLPHSSFSAAYLSNQPQSETDRRRAASARLCAHCA